MNGPWQRILLKADAGMKKLTQSATGMCGFSVTQMGVVWRLRVQLVEGTWVTFSRAKASQPPLMLGTA
jgi:hypothetical protein